MKLERLVRHSTHLEALANTLALAGPGPLIEFGGGWFSTPVLRGFAAAQKRALVTVETDTVWHRRLVEDFADSGHLVLLAPMELPAAGPWAVALVDGYDRARWVRWLYGKAEAVVVHDTEPKGVDENPGLDEAMALYGDQRTFDRWEPWTTVLRP